MAETDSLRFALDSRITYLEHQPHASRPACMSTEDRSDVTTVREVIVIVVISGCGIGIVDVVCWCSSNSSRSSSSTRGVG